VKTEIEKRVFDPARLADFGFRASLKAAINFDLKLSK
jgi:hypothetical protein